MNNNKEKDDFYSPWGTENDCSIKRMILDGTWNKGRSSFIGAIQAFGITYVLNMMCGFSFLVAGLVAHVGLVSAYIAVPIMVLMLICFVLLTSTHIYEYRNLMRFALSMYSTVNLLFNYLGPEKYNELMEEMSEYLKNQIEEIESEKADSEQENVSST